MTGDAFGRGYEARKQMGRLRHLPLDDRQATGNLTDGLRRLRESAVKLASSDAREIASRFGQLGGRRLAMAG